MFAALWKAHQEAGFTPCHLFCIYCSLKIPPFTLIWVYLSPFLHLADPLRICLELESFMSVLLFFLYCALVGTSPTFL